MEDAMAVLGLSNNGAALVEKGWKLKLFLGVFLAIYYDEIRLEW